MILWKKKLMKYPIRWQTVVPTSIENAVMQHLQMLLSAILIYTECCKVSTKIIPDYLTKFDSSDNTISER